ncbi:hypothetical protein PPYR_00239 [Photinus pyralis]|uniref:3-hydroxyisobutyrate dehydrogenase n=1 Tax=Photinus pyralis TaxID=7054 RepID=A0A5N4B0Z1_PHOPY|nr:3-hydroxyisobutyrate dehydrogenase, mitochondrial-like [Photinus pyralis]KAB0803269.1 hypothetical protein PPYR_00239 [Photinus pyralis]
MFQNRLLASVKTIQKFYSQRNKSDVGFIGVGNMGQRMATNLIKKGRRVKVYDVSKAAMESVTGALPCESPQEAAADVDFVITMLPDGDVVKQVLTAENGVLKGISKRALLVDSSTINPLTARELHKTAEDAGIKFLDAPVAGGTAGASAGTLTFMVGGNQDAVKAAQAILLQMGGNVMHCGGPGAGQISKLCNNMIVAVSMIGVAEAMNLGAKMGLDVNTLVQVVNTSTGRCWISEKYNPVPGVMKNVPSANDYNGGFRSQLMAKDLALASSIAISCGAPILLGSAAHEIYRTMAAYGYGNKDYSSIYKFLQGQH